MGKKWTEKQNEWLYQHRTEKHKELYELFSQKFPDFDTTETGVANQRSRIGACLKKNPNKAPRTASPLYSEHIKKGYVQIKIAQPNVWMMKSKWVWLETHPWAVNEVSDDNLFIFLDGNNRNFNPENIEKVTRAELRLLTSPKNKIIKDNPELTMINLSQVRLKIAMLDAGEKYDLVSNYGAGRAFKKKRVEWARTSYERKRNTPEFQKKCHEYYKKAKASWTPEQIEKQRKYKKEWAKKQRLRNVQ